MCVVVSLSRCVLCADVCVQVIIVFGVPTWLEAIVEVAWDTFRPQFPNSWQLYVAVVVCIAGLCLLRLRVCRHAVGSCCAHGKDRSFNCCRLPWDGWLCVWYPATRYTATEAYDEMVALFLANAAYFYSAVVFILFSMAIGLLLSFLTLRFRNVVGKLRAACLARALSCTTIDLYPPFASGDLLRVGSSLPCQLFVVNKLPV